MVTCAVNSPSLAQVPLLFSRASRTQIHFSIDLRPSRAPLQSLLIALLPLNGRAGPAAEYPLTLLPSKSNKFIIRRRMEPWCPCSWCRRRAEGVPALCQHFSPDMEASENASLHSSPPTPRT